MSKGNVVLTIPEPNKTELVKKPYPNIKGGYIIVRNEYAGICLEGTRIWAKHDFEKFYGGGQSDYPDGLGHESVGVVEEVLPGSNFTEGDRVVIFRGDHCGHCHACLNALSPTYCVSDTLPPKPGQTRVGMAGIQDLNESESGGRMLCNPRVQKNVDAMVTHVFPMSQAGEAFDVQVSKQCGKIFLDPQKIAA